MPAPLVVPRRTRAALPVAAVVVALAAGASAAPGPDDTVPVPLGATRPVWGDYSAYVSCPDTLSVDWAAPTVVFDDDAVTVRRYSARNQGGRDTTVTVASGHPGEYQLLARGPQTLGSSRTTSQSVAASAIMLVGVNGGYFWRTDNGGDLSKGTQVRDGRVLYQPAGGSRYVGRDATGWIGAGRAHARGAVTAKATTTAKAVWLPLVAVNSPPAGNGVTVYTRNWPSDEPRHGGSWEVYVRKGVVVAAGPTVRAVLAGSPPAENRFVVRASGTAGTRLRSLKVGRKVSYTAQAVEAGGRVLTQSTVGGTTLLVGGVVKMPCERVTIRPRTMVAWNNRTHAMWLVTVTGGADWRDYGMYVGATYHQMALLAKKLGATHAVLVDGGGSTTMIVRRPTGVLDRVDGPFTRQRSVPDILGIAPR